MRAAAPQKICDGDQSFDVLKQKLSSVGLQIKVSSEVKTLEPEVGVIVGFQTKHLVDGEVKLNVSNARFRIKQGTYHQWCTSAETLFGSPKSAGKFQHGGVTVTIYENGTVMVQGVRSVDWLVTNFSQWLQCTHSAQDGSKCDSISLSTTPSTPVSVPSMTLTPRNLCKKQLTPSAPPASQGTPTSEKPLTPSAPPSQGDSKCESVKQLTPSAPEFVPKQVPHPSLPTHGVSVPSQSETTIFYSPIGIVPQHTEVGEPHVVTSTPIVQVPNLIDIEYVSELRNNLQGKDNEISELKIELERKEEEISDLKRQFSQQKLLVKNLIKQNDDLVIKLEVQQLNKPADKPGDEPSTEEPVQKEVHLQSSPTIPLVVPQIKLVIRPTERSLAEAHDIGYVTTSEYASTSNGTPVAQSSVMAEQDDYLSCLSDYTTDDSSCIDEMPSANQSTQQLPTSSNNPRKKRLVIPPSDDTRRTQSQTPASPTKPMWFRGTGANRQNKVLSNLHHCAVSVFGKQFDSREHAYQWSKAVYHGLSEKADLIFNAESASQAMEFGKKIPTCQAWELEVKFDKMKEIQIAAVSTCKKLQEKLLSSGDRPIKERTTHHTWGALKDGGNMMGIFHEESRELLRTGQIESADSACPCSKPQSKTTQDKGNKEENTSQRETPRAKSTPSNPKSPKKTGPSKKKLPQKGLFFGDSMSRDVNPDIYGGEFATISVSGGRLCPRPNSNDNHTNLNKLLQNSMTGEEEHIVLGFGTNDSTGCDLDKFETRYRSLVETAQSSGAQVYCSGIYHRGDLTDPSARYARNRVIDDLNQIIMAISDELGCVYIDNCAAVVSTAQKPNLHILTKPSRGVKLLHLTVQAKLDLKYRIEDSICTAQQRKYRSPPKPKSKGRRISKPNSRGWYRRSAPSPPYPTHGDQSYNEDLYYEHDGYYGQYYGQYTDGYSYGSDEYYYPHYMQYTSRY